MEFQMGLGIVLVLALIVGVGLWSGRRVKSKADFLTGGGQAGPALVCGALMGSLVSAQSTIGSAQMAFYYGLTAWWFTLGSGLGCLLMALGYVRALRASGCVTELQVISKEYGGAAESVGAVLSALGIFITVLSQIIACIGLFTILFPNLSIAWAAVLTVAVMGCYVVFGGAWGAGMGGVVKVALLYLAFMAGIVLVLRCEGGLPGLAETLSNLLAGTPLGMVQRAAANVPNVADGGDLAQRFASLTARGLPTDMGSCLSLIVGVLSTQTYAQAVWSAKTDAAARRGVLISALLIPILGAAGILMGLSVRAHYITQAEAEALAAAGQAIPDLPVLASTLHVLPAFAMDHMPPLMAGAVLGTLLITVIGGGAGLSLGMATILVEDLYRRATKRIDTASKELLATRLTIVGILAVGAALAVLAHDSKLNDLGFLSMGLRGAVVFAPMTCALMMKGRIRPPFIMAAIVLGPSAVAAVPLLGLPVDPILSGTAVSIACCLAGLIFQPSKEVRARA